MSYKSPDAAVSALCNVLPTGPFNKAALDALVTRALETTPSSSSAELRRAKWELALKTNIFDLAVGLLLQWRENYHIHLCGADE